MARFRTNTRRVRFSEDSRICTRTVPRVGSAACRSLRAARAGAVAPRPCRAARSGPSRPMPSGPALAQVQHVQQWHTLQQLISNYALARIRMLIASCTRLEQ